MLGEVDKNEGRLIRAYGEWMNESDWDHYATATFASRTDEWSAQRRFRGWMRQLERVVYGPVEAVAVLEGRSEGRVHLHALIRGSKALTDYQVARYWRHGRKIVERFDPELGGAFYLAKGLGSGRSELVLYPTSARVSS